MFDAETIKTLRLALGLTLAEFGELVGVSESTVCCWETDRNHPSYKAGQRLNQIADEFASGKRKPIVRAPAAKEPRPRVHHGPRQPKTAKNSS